MLGFGRMADFPFVAKPRKEPFEDAEIADDLSRVPTLEKRQEELLGEPGGEVPGVRPDSERDPEREA